MPTANGSTIERPTLDDGPHRRNAGRPGPIVSGSIVVETIFSLNGMGRLTVDAIKAGDIELFLGTTLMILILKLLCYLGADIAYTIADPRVSFSGSGQ